MRVAIERVRKNAAIMPIRAAITPTRIIVVFDDDAVDRNEAVCVATSLAALFW